MLQPAVRTPYYLIHLEASWPDSHVFNCSVPAMIVKLQQSKQWSTSSFQSRNGARFLAPSYPGVVTLDWKMNVPSHVGHTFSCLYFKSQEKTIHNYYNSMLEVRWHHCLNESKVKTAERCSPMSQQTNAKGWQAENPDGPSRSSKGADEEMLYPEVADFWHPGTIFTAEGHGVPCILWMKLLKRSFWYDARWAFVSVPAVPSHLPCLSLTF